MSCLRILVKPHYILSSCCHKIGHFAHCILQVMAAPLAPVKTHHSSTVEQSLNLLTPPLMRSVCSLCRLSPPVSTVYFMLSEVLPPLLLYSLQWKVDKNIYSKGQLWPKVNKINVLRQEAVNMVVLASTFTR